MARVVIHKVDMVEIGSLYVGEWFVAGDRVGVVLGEPEDAPEDYVSCFLFKDGDNGWLDTFHNTKRVTPVSVKIEVTLDNSKDEEDDDA